METRWVRIDEVDGLMYKTMVIAKDIGDIPRWFYFIEVYKGPIPVVKRRLLPAGIAINLTASDEYGFALVA